MLPWAPRLVVAPRRGIGSRATFPSPERETSTGRCPRSPVVLRHSGRRVSTVFSLAALVGSVRSANLFDRTSTFLHPFARRPLRRFYATMDALTPGRSALRLGAHEHRPNTPQVSRIHLPDLPTIPPPTTWCAQPSLSHATPQRGWLPSPGGEAVWVSPFASKLTATPGRIEFVILRTGRSPPVALHLASLRRSYSRLQTGERLSEEDLHLPNRVNFPSHWHGHSCPWMQSSTDRNVRATRTREVISIQLLVRDRPAPAWS